jgi:hypothetical protein
MNKNKERLVNEIELIEKQLEKKFSIEFVNKVRTNFGFSYSIPIKAKDYKKYLLENNFSNSD